jgi:hypothetical protein
MERISSLLIDRFRRLPRVGADTWQGGLVRLPTWLGDGGDGRPYRPWGAVWVSRSGSVHLKIESARGQADWQLAVEALLELGLKRHLAGCRPGSIEVSDDALADRLRQVLGLQDLVVTVLPELPAVSLMLLEMERSMGGGRPAAPGALHEPGVTIERLRAFAEAARRFYEAAPWRYLTDEDLISIETPTAPTGLRHVTVLGAGGHTYGLGFFHSREEHDALQTDMAPHAVLQQAPWSLWFGPITEMPISDVDLWEAHHLPVAGDDAYPVAAQVSADEEIRRPDAGTLAYLEGLLRVLAETTEEEIDAGRCWSHSMLLSVNRQVGGSQTGERWNDFQRRLAGSWPALSFRI